MGSLWFQLSYQMEECDVRSVVVRHRASDNTTTLQHTNKPFTSQQLTSTTNDEHEPTIRFTFSQVYSNQYDAFSLSHPHCHPVHIVHQRECVLHLTLICTHPHGTDYLQLHPASNNHTIQHRSLRKEGGSCPRK